MKKLLIFIPILVLITGLVAKKPTPSISVSDQKYRIVVFALNLNVPWSMVFTDRNRLLVTERNGAIRVIENGILRTEPLYKFEDVWNKEEAGLMGLTVDPDYKNNKLIYASLTYTKDKAHMVKVVRLVDKATTATFDKVLIDGIVAAVYHDGSRIKFGPDRKLYITTGEATKVELAQNLKSLNGKILRINPDGSIPIDNPFPNSPVYSYGHRNPQGIDWDPVTGNLWETEHGPSGIDGPGGGDEINLIKAGANYGWPKAHHEIKLAGTEYPKVIFTPAIAPAGAMFYRGDLLTSFKNNLFFTGLRGEGVWRAMVSKTDSEKIDSFEKLSLIEVGRIREIIEGPDGAIYFSTSNRDGRGAKRENDDKIYKITTD